MQLLLRIICTIHNSAPHLEVMTLSATKIRAQADTRCYTSDSLAELVKAQDLKSCGATRVGSNPAAVEIFFTTLKGS